jgi:hypothetical protein
MAGEHNGIPLELGILLGKFDTILSRQIHLTEALHETSIRQEATAERQEAILERMDQNILALPVRLSETMQGSATRPSETQGILKAIPPILKACVPILTIIGLMTGKIAWTDIPNLLGH